MDKLSEIMAAKAREIESRVRPVADNELLGCREMSERPSFARSLKQGGRLAVIAEVKRKSPSAGIIRERVDAEEQALAYAGAGADALSILTDEPYFGGTLADLQRSVSGLRAKHFNTPCLRKDFMLHPVQVLEAAEAGASAILIIVRALETDAMRALYEAAQMAGLDALFEIHEERELEQALTLEAKIIGVNNRDLRRFRTDLAISEALIPQIPADLIRISESGIATAEDARRARDCGADAVLVGESLMRAESLETAFQTMRAGH